LLHDDARGVGEALNETVCVLDKCEGLTVSIPYHLTTCDVYDQYFSTQSCGQFSTIQEDHMMYFVVLLLLFLLQLSSLIDI
jgi:hypothetical protein